MLHHEGGEVGAGAPEARLAVHRHAPDPSPSCGARCGARCSARAAPALGLGGAEEAVEHLGRRVRAVVVEQVVVPDALRREAPGETGQTST